MSRTGARACLPAPLACVLRFLAVAGMLSSAAGEEPAAGFSVVTGDPSRILITPSVTTASASESPYSTSTQPPRRLPIRTWRMLARPLSMV